MRLVTYQHEGQSRSGVLLDEQVVDLNRAYRAMLQPAGNEDELAVADARVPTDMIGLLRGGESSLKAAQEATTFVRNRLEEMIFGVPAIVSYISEIVTLDPGDVILTGTPAGIGNTRTPPVFMKPGDTVTIEIGILGRLTNLVVAEE